MLADVKEVTVYEVRTRHVQEQPTLAMTNKLRVDEIKGWIGDAYSAIAGHIARQGLRFTGPPFARYRPLDDQFREFEIEAGFPVDRPGAREGDVIASSLPEAEVAVVTHIGPYDQMRPAYEAISRWIEEHEGHPEGAAWEVYYSDPEAEPDPKTWRTEIVQPYRVL